MLDKTKYLAWVDLETTGSDKRKDHILEVGFVLTEATPTLDIIEGAQWVVDPAKGPTNHYANKEQWFNDMSEFVTRMHSENGLLADVKAGGRDIRSVDDTLVTILQNNGIVNRPDCMLAGSGVGHFDKAFIERDLPRFASMLYYPVLDVGVIRRSLKLAGVDVEALIPDAGADHRSHRAMDDILHHREELLTYLEVFGGRKGLTARTSSEGEA